MKPSSISATTQRVSTPESAWIERPARKVISRMIPRWLWTLLILTMLFSVHCGGEEVCPSGTGGEPCKPIGDLGPQPEVPTTPDSHLADAENGDADSVADTHTKDMDQHDLKVGDGSDTHPHERWMRMMIAMVYQRRPTIRNKLTRRERARAISAI